MSENHDEGQRWRHALLDVSLHVLSAVSIVVTLATVLQPLRQTQLPYGLGFVVCLSGLASWRRSLGYRARTLCLLLGAHLVWSLPLLRLGIATPNVSVGFFLEAVLATLLLNGRAGLVTTVLSALTFAFAFVLQHYGLLAPRPVDWYTGFDSTLPHVIARIAFVAAAGSAAAVMGISYLLRSLEHAIAQRDSSLARVESENAARVQVLQELEQHEADFLRARELEVLGRLSGFVAHDFNNALLAIFGATELVRMARNERERDDALAIVRDAASQAASTVKQLRAFGPQLHSEQKPIDPLHVVLSIERLLRTLLPKNVDLVVSPQPTAAICVDEGLLQSALMNLSLNAWDAMRDGGRLEIRVRPAAADFGVNAVNGVKGCVFIEVQDSGVGMDEAARARLFAPFYTTKGSHGTGLGLASVRQTVEAAQGTVSVDSHVGQGTCVRLCFPAVPQSTRSNNELERGASPEARPS